MVEVRSALASMASENDLRPAIEHPDIRFQELPVGDLVSVSAWPDCFVDVSENVSGVLGVEVPETYRVASGNDVHTVYMVAPHRFLIVSEVQGLGVSLLPCLDGDKGTLTELGHSRTRIRIHGPNARALLARGVAIDLDPTVFSSGEFVQSAIHHMWLLIHNVSSEQEGDAYDVYVLRSFAVSFWHWLVSSVELLGNETSA